MAKLTKIKVSAMDANRIIDMLRFFAKNHNDYIGASEVAIKAEKMADDLQKNRRLVFIRQRGLRNENPKLRRKSFLS